MVSNNHNMLACQPLCHKASSTTYFKGNYYYYASFWSGQMHLEAIEMLLLFIYLKGFSFSYFYDKLL